MLRFRFLSKGMLAAISLSVIIALLISVIPYLELFKLDRDLPVFKQQKQYMISENNIVDFIASFSTKMKIKRVTWQHDALSIDLLLSKDSQVDTEIIYQELYQIIQKGFVQTDNVKEMLIRVFIDDMSKIFVAVSANRKNIINNPTLEIADNMQHKDFLEEIFGLNYGNLIKQE